MHADSVTDDVFELQSTLKAQMMGKIKARQMAELLLTSVWRRIVISTTHERSATKLILYYTPCQLLNSELELHCLKRLQQLNTGSWIQQRGLTGFVNDYNHRSLLLARNFM